MNAGVKYIEEIEKFLEPYVQFPLTILDWGGDTSKNTPFTDKNDALDIYDISNKDTIAGARIVTQDKAYSNRYRLIVCSNVLEHVPYPSQLLTDIAKAMNSEAVLNIEVPLEDIMLSKQDDIYLKKRH